MSRIRTAAQRRLAEWIDRSADTPSHLFQVTATFEDERRAECATAVLEHEADVVTVTQAGTDVIALFERPAGELLVMADEARRVRARLISGHLEPAELVARRGVRDRGRTVHRLRYVGDGQPTPEERAVLASDEARLLPLHEEVPHPDHPDLVWTDVPGVTRLNPPALGLVGAGALLWSASIVELSRGGRWVTPLVAVAALLVLVAAVATWRSLGSLDGFWRSFCRALAVLALPACHLLGWAGARIMPTPLTWPVFLSTLGALALYVVVMRWLIALWRSSAGAWRRFGATLLAVVGGLGVIGWLQGLPRELVQRGLGYGQTPLAMSTSSVLLSMNPAIALGSISLIVLTLVTLAVLGAKVPGTAFVLVAPVIAAVGAMGALLAGANLYEIGAELRAGHTVEAGQIARCVRITTADDPTAMTSWSAPRVLVGSSTGPSLVIDPAHAAAAPVVVPEALVVQPLPAKDCRRTP